MKDLLMIKNRYGNECGIHTPKMTMANKLKIENATKIQFEDCSWHNDVCDAISNEYLNIQIHLPNSSNENFDDEEYNTYTISSYDGENVHMEHKDKMYSFLQVISVITNIYRKKMIDKIWHHCRHTHNAQDCKDLQEFSSEELQEILNSININNQ